MGNWVFYWLKFMSKGEIGIADAFAFGLALILEIPSGAVGDLLGKKRTLIFSFALQLIGALMMAFIDDKILIIIGNTFFWIGTSFMSGTLEAFGFDSMVEKGKEKFYEVVAGKYGFLEISTVVIAVGIGGLLYRFNDRLPWIAWALFIFVALIVSLVIKEPSVDTEKFSWKTYNKQLRIGFRNLWSKRIRNYFIVFVVLGGIYRLWAEGFVRPLMGDGFNFDGETLSYTLSFIALIASFNIFFFKAIRTKLGDIWGISFIIILMSLGFGIAAFFHTPLIGFFALLIIYVSGKIRNPWASVILNPMIESKYRATTLSSLALVTGIPYVFVAIFAGQLAEEGMMEYFYLGIAIILLLTLIYYLFTAKFKEESIET